MSNLTHTAPATQLSNEWVREEALEVISDKIRSGIPVGFWEAIAAIDYQTARQAYARQNVWWRRAIRWVRRIK